MQGIAEQGTFIFA